MDDERYIVSIVKKHVIAEDLYIYSHVCTSVGTIDKDDEGDMFEDDQGRCFYYLDDDDTLFSSDEFAFASPVTLDEAYKMFPGIEPDAQSIMSAYEDTYGRQFYMVSIGEDGEKVYTPFSIDSTISGMNEYMAKVNDQDDVKSFNLDELKEALEKNTLTISEMVGFKEIVANSTDLFADLTFAELNRIKEINKLLDEKLKDVDTSKYKVNVNSSPSRKVTNNDDKAINNQTINSAEKGFKSTEETKTEIKDIDIDDVYKKVTKTLIGQDEAADRLITEIARLDMDDSNRYGILVTGSTGVGKTKLMSLIAKYINRPFMTIDSTQLSTPGYTGRSIEEFLWELYINCDKDVKKAERAIIFFDEIDKKGSKNKDDVGGKGVLNVLLKFLDGTTYHATENMQHSYQSVKINTSKMIVLSGGAFTDVFKNEGSNPIGFTNENKKKKYEPTSDDFVEKAMMTDEFMGRHPIRVHLNDLSVEALLNILNKSDESPLKREINHFKKLNIDLRFTKEAKKLLAEKAYKLKEGGRGLQGVVVDVTYPSFRYAKKNQDKIDNITITEETVEDNENYKVKVKSQAKRR